MWDVFLTFHITPIDVSIALKLRPVAQKCLLAYFVLKIAIISTKILPVGSWHYLFCLWIEFIHFSLKKSVDFCAK